MWSHRDPLSLTARSLFESLINNTLQWKINRNSNILIQENVFENISTPNSVRSTRVPYWLVILVNIVAQSYLQSHQSPSQTGLPLVIGQWWFPMWHLEQTTHHNKIMQILHPASLDVNLLVLEKCVISCCTRAFIKLILRVDILSIICEIGLRRVSQNPT